MNDYKDIVEKHSCKPNQGCGTATTCMCGLAEDMADEIERLREALNEIACWEDGEFGPHMCEPSSARKARAALGEGE
jgi:hypothetical protein